MGPFSIIFTNLHRCSDCCWGGTRWRTRRTSRTTRWLSDADGVVGRQGFVVVAVVVVVVAAAVLVVAVDTLHIGFVVAVEPLFGC